jgi:hypothetical protein
MNRKISRLVFVVCALGTAVAGLTGCSTRVQPWQRGNLADYTMRADRDPLTNTMSEHIYFSREASAGGRGIGGGGCGCN